MPFVFVEFGWKRHCLGPGQRYDASMESDANHVGNVYTSVHLARPISIRLLAANLWLCVGVIVDGDVRALLRGPEVHEDDNARDAEKIYSCRRSCKLCGLVHVCRCKMGGQCECIYVRFDESQLEQLFRCQVQFSGAMTLFHAGLRAAHVIIASMLLLANDMPACMILVK